MSTAQKAASAGAWGSAMDTTVTNLTLDSNDSAGVIATLLAETAVNSTTVEASMTGMDAAERGVGDIANVQVINDMELTDPLATNAGDHRPAQQGWRRPA